MTKKQTEEERVRPGPKPERGETSKMYGVRLTKGEHDDYQADADRRGMSFAEWIRAACAAFLKRRK